MFTFKALPLKTEQYLAPLTIFTLALLGYFFDQTLSGFLIYNRDAINNGEYWRIISGHLFHTNLQHFLLNGAALILLWGLHGHYYQIKYYLSSFILIAIICSVGMHLFSPDITLYVGLSGVLHGFFIWGALMDIKHGEKTGYLLFAGVVLKLAHEQIYGASADVESLIDASVAVDAHLYGAIGGMIIFLIGIIYRRKI